MDTLEIHETKQEIIKEYNKRHIGWKAWLSRSDSGFYNWLFFGPNSAWYLKTDSIYTGNSIGRGGRIDLDVTKFSGDETPYGFRQFPVGKLVEAYKRLELAKTCVKAGRFDEAREILNDTERIMEEISETMEMPVPTSSITEPVLLEGSYHLTYNPLLLSKDQKKLDEKLEAELKQLLRIKYPQYR